MSARGRRASPAHDVARVENRDERWSAARPLRSPALLDHDHTAPRRRLAASRPLAQGALMKPAPFAYQRPSCLEEACALLGGDEDASVIAGGQTLVPLLAMRLARPTLLVDIQRLQELQALREEAGVIVVGAATRQADAERSALVASRLPLLGKALPWVGHPATRARGTIGGSIANADPAAEIPLVAVALNAEMAIVSAQGDSCARADAFFVSAMVTTLVHGQIVKAIRFPIWTQTRIGSGFREISQRRSDFALAAAAAQVALDEHGRCAECAVAVGGFAHAPTRLRASSALRGLALSEQNIRDAISDEIDSLEANADGHASADYRRRAAKSLALGALLEARGEALGRRA